MRHLYPIALCVALVACGNEEHEDLRNWMHENTKDLKGNVPKLPPVIPYQPVPYVTDTLMDPFNAAKIEPESKRGGSGTGKAGALQPNFEARDLRNSLLEKYPLESLKMIGYLNVGKQPLAVIQVEQHVKQVKIGDYIGQDFGIVTQITEQEVTLRELIQDSAGDWSERTSTLQMQAKEGSKK